MSTFLEIAADTHQWLQRLQITQRLAPAYIADGNFHFELQHPTRGKIVATSRVSNAPLFQCQGIALRVPSRYDRETPLEVYDAGGIFDPLDGRVQGEHYSTTHFALLSAILFNETHEERYLQHAQMAIDFHLRTSPDQYYFSDWYYHWDFQNYAFLLTYKLLRHSLPPDVAEEWRRGLLSWRTNHDNKLTNWAAMRAWAHFERAKLFSKWADWAACWWNLRHVRRARHTDGCFDDNAGRSRPIQYHVFTVAILHRLYQLMPLDFLRAWVLAGVDYLLPFIDPDGDYNYIGRGQEQIFGYAVAIYALEAALRLRPERKYQDGSDRLLSFLLRHRRDGHFPLVLNSRPDEERCGWYDYHHLTVYNAFLGVWLGLAHLLGDRPAVTGASGKKRYFFFSKPTNAAVVSTTKYFVACTGGLPEYLSEASVTPQHLWWENLGWIYSCPGGPSPELFGKRWALHSERNFWAPLAKVHERWLTPAGRKASLFTAEAQRLRMRLDYGLFVFDRRLEFGDEVLIFEDRFHFAGRDLVQELHFFNLPVAIDRFTFSFGSPEAVQLRCKQHIVDVRITACDFPDAGFEALDTVKTARGMARLLVKRLRDFQPAAGEEHFIRFSIRAGQRDGSA